MIESCRIVAQGLDNGKKSYTGRPKKDREGFINEFLVDSGYFYTKVLQHLKECHAPIPCDPVQVLQAYMGRRMSRANGTTSAGLVALALKYEAFFRPSNPKAAGKNPVPKDLVNEFIWRSANPKIITYYENRISSSQALEGFKKQFYAQRDRISSEPTSLHNVTLMAFDQANALVSSPWKREVGTRQSKYRPLMLILAEHLKKKKPLPPDDVLEDLATVAGILGS